MAFFKKKKSGYRIKGTVIWNIFVKFGKKLMRRNSEKLKFKDVLILIGSLL